MIQKSEPFQPIDPVCGMALDSDKTPYKVTYDGAERFFCSAGCRSRFKRSPEDFVVPRRKGLWRRYLDRLNKTTGGKPPSCCH